MPLEIHALMQDAQDFHGSGCTAAEEDDVAMAGDGQKAGPQIAAISSQGGRLRQQSERLVKLGQIVSA